MKKKMVCMLITAALLTGACAMPITAGAANKTLGTTIIYDGQSLSFDVEPVNIDGTVLVPMRAIFETFGAKVKWDGDTMTVTAKKGSKVYTMTIGDSMITLTKDGEVISTVAADQALQVIDGRTMIPLRALSELLGLDVSWDGSTQTVTITTPADDENDAWKDNTGVIDITSLTTDSDSVTVSGKVITVTAGGDYTVTGTNKDAQIVVDTDEKVKLRLSGVELTNTDGAAIYVKNADKCYITLTDGTVNTLTDGGEYTEESETNACIYSKDDLEIKGKGILTVNGTRHNGITAKDDLSIENGSITVNSVADGIHVNDTAEISGGTVTITAAEDGIQSESILDIKGGELTITCTGEVTESTSDMLGSSTADEDDDVSSKGLKAEWLMDISGGAITVNSNDTCVKCDSELDINGGTVTLTSNSKKGIKGLEDVYINGGTIVIQKSTEGIETKRTLTINDGDISIVASDDGINAGGGNSMQGFGGMGGGRGMMGGNMQQMTPPEMQNGDTQQMTPPEMQNGDMQNGGMQRGMQGGRSESTTVSTEHHIQINGGYIAINSQGDGIDSNGSIIINGGSVYVNGPENNGNGAIDHDGLFQVNGGTLLAVGSSGMVENPAASSEQNVISAYISASAGDEITIKSSSGATLLSYKAEKAAGHVMYSSSDIKTDETYTVYVNGTEQGSAAISAAVTTIGTQSQGMGGFGGGRRMMQNALAE